MPAQRLTSAQPTTVYRYDLLAQVDESSDLMVHALICNESETRPNVTDATILKTFHMGPPLGSRKFSCDAAGSANLTANQRRKIKTFLDDRQAEKDAEKKRVQLLGLAWDPSLQYRIHPAATPPSRRYPLWRFSCVGLVLETYKTARIVLLQQPFPLKTIDDLKQLYPSAASHLDNPEIREQLGVGSGDRWPVALVGYVMHSLARSADAINSEISKDAAPYQPQVGDEHFPRHS